MYILNKIVGGLLNPVAVALLLMLAGAVCAWFRRRRTAVALLAVAFAGQWLWSTAALHHVIGIPLEDAYPVVRVEELPTADAIVVLGGGIHANLASYPYPDLDAAADRVWHAARLYRAGKAPQIIATGRGDRDAAVPFLVDLGVPATAIAVENEARNTEENARFVAELLKGKVQDGRKPRILLVTSACHMRRAMLMYARYAPELEIVPAAADYVARSHMGEWRFRDFMPSSDFMEKNAALLKEIVGYWGYRLFRR